MPLNLERPTVEGSFAFPQQLFITMYVLPIGIVFRRVIAQKTQVEKIRGDLRILEILQQKDERANLNLGDPASFLNVYDPDKEVEKVSEFMANGMTPTQVSLPWSRRFPTRRVRNRPLITWRSDAQIGDRPAPALRRAQETPLLARQADFPAAWRHAW